MKKNLIIIFLLMLLSSCKSMDVVNIGAAVISSVE